MSSSNTNRNQAILSFLLLLFSASFVSQVRQVSASPAREQSFKRLDPLRQFKNYNGVYDVRNKHYWASAAFTGVHGYVVAGVWLLSGLAFGIFIALKHQNMSNWTIKDFLHHHYLLMFFLVLLFTFLAIIASGLVLLANRSSVKGMENLKETILSVGGEARYGISKIIKAMTNMEYLLAPYNSRMAATFNVTTHRLGNQSKLLQYFIHKNGRAVDNAIQTSYVAHIMVVTANLVLIVAALVLILLHWYPGFIIIIFLCWIFTTLFWVLTGFDFFLHNFAEDTCSAFEEFELSPKNSSLSAMLPCMDPANAEKMMVEIGYIVHTFITQLNAKVPDYYKLLGVDIGENESGLEINICNPFDGAPNYRYVPKSCPKNAIPISLLPNVLASLTCYEEDNVENCKSNGKFISEAAYNMASAYSGSAQDLLNIYPDLQSLTRCTLVKDKFSYVVLHECKPFRVAVRLLWASMLSLSIFMAVLVLTWLAKAVQDRGRSFSLCSITPKDTAQRL
ncbi:hypothetical protein UlMin_039024 [Ulmus minor]